MVFPDCHRRSKNNRRLLQIMTDVSRAILPTEVLTMQVYKLLSTSKPVKAYSNITVLGGVLVRDGVKRESLAKSIPSLSLIMVIVASWGSTVPVSAEHDRVCALTQAPLSGAKSTITGVTSGRRKQGQKNNTSLTLF